MKLIRFGEKGEEKPGALLDNGKRIDVSAFCQDWNRDSLKTKQIDEFKTWLQSNASSSPEVSDDCRWAEPIAQPGKLICVGLNYRKHALEAGMKPPEEPVLFFKANSAICGPFDPVLIPPGAKKLDWEVELAIVISEQAQYISKENALDYVGGYLLHNDYSERSYQLERGGQWVKGKSCDHFAPLGPFVASKDEIENPNQLDLWLKVNGEIKQKENTKDFIFNVQEVVSYISHFMTLQPGDIISTGTPSGVGLGMKPPQFLQAGDEVELGIQGLGVSKQKVIQDERVSYL